MTEIVDIYIRLRHSTKSSNDFHPNAVQIAVFFYIILRLCELYGTIFIRPISSHSQMKNICLLHLIRDWIRTQPQHIITRAFENIYS